MLRKFLEGNVSNKRLVLPAEFFIKMALVYLSWRTFKYFGESYEDFLWGGWNCFKNMVGIALTTTSATILKIAGYDLTYYHRMITVDGTAGIYIGDLCLGIAPMVIFSGFIFSFGNNLKAKAWFIPAGILGIYTMNVIRTIALVLVQVHHNAWFKTAHEYVYVTITYGFIFLMVMWWMNKLAYKKSV